MDGVPDYRGQKIVRKTFKYESYIKNRSAQDGPSQSVKTEWLSFIRVNPIHFQKWL